MSDHMTRARESLLLRRTIQQKDRRSLSLLYAKYYTRLRRYVASRINSPAEAEDLAQNVFVELYESDGRGHPEDFHNAEAYLFGIARNLIRQHYHSAAKCPRPLDTPALEAIAADRRRAMHQPATPAECDDTQDLILKALNRLAPAARQALRLAIIDELPPDQAAPKANCSLNAFYQRLHVVRKTLRQLLAEQRSTKT
ncbi:MAG: RNA polymerase sigma factor [Planctomycetota bacterium]